MYSVHVMVLLTGVLQCTCLGFTIFSTLNFSGIYYKVTLKWLVCKDDLKLLKYDYFKGNLCHRFIKLTDRTLDVVFSIFLRVSFTITLRQKPKGVTFSRRRDSLSLCSTPTTRKSFGLLPKGICERNTHKSWKDDI